MPINEWWAGEPEERYWLEITDRETLGLDLYAPQTDQSGNETWSYSLVSCVQDGDIVYHYWKQPGQDKAIVGYSRATGALETSTITWTPHGTYSRAQNDNGLRPAWRFPLADFRDLATPVTLEKLRDLEPELRALTEKLVARHDGPLYLPFAFSDKRPLRTAQGYLTKLPASFIAAIPGLGAATDIPIPKRASDAQAGRMLPAEEPVNRQPAISTGYQSDPKVRKALERHAVSSALHYFSDKGYLVEDVGDSNPYDVLAIDDTSELHIEVKGSAGTSTTVELTAGEVNEARSRSDASAVLFVVDQIEWSRSPSGDITTSGGRTRIWSSWVPEDQRLTPTSYRYLLPPLPEVAR